MTFGTRSYAVDVLALALILTALAVALTKTSGLTAPHDHWDHFRDIAQAQTVRDGAPLSDQYYRDEWVWYNPLLPWTLALGSAITGTSRRSLPCAVRTLAESAGPVGVLSAGRQVDWPHRRVHRARYLLVLRDR